MGEDSCDFHDASCGNMLETVSLCSPPKGPMGSLWLHECLIPWVVWGDWGVRCKNRRTRRRTRRSRREVIRLWQRRVLWRRCAINKHFEFLRGVEIRLSLWERGRRKEVRQASRDGRRRLTVPWVQGIPHMVLVLANATTFSDRTSTMHVMFKATWSTFAAKHLM